METEFKTLSNFICEAQYFKEKSEVIDADNVKKCFELIIKDLSEKLNYTEEHIRRIIFYRTGDKLIEGSSYNK